MANSADPVGFFRSQLILIYTVCKGRVYPGSAGQGLSNTVKLYSLPLPLSWLVQQTTN